MSLVSVALWSTFKLTIVTDLSQVAQTTELQVMFKAKQVSLWHQVKIGSAVNRPWFVLFEWLSKVSAGDQKTTLIHSPTTYDLHNPKNKNNRDITTMTATFDQLYLHFTPSDVPLPVSVCFGRFFILHSLLNSCLNVGHVSLTLLSEWLMRSFRY